MTIETLIIFAIILALVLALIYLILRIKPGGSISREDQMAREIKQQAIRIGSLQETIDMLSGRISDLQGQISRFKEENERLRFDLNRYLPGINWRATEKIAIGIALGRLNTDEIKRMAFERFRPVFDSFGAEQSLQAQRLALLEYAENHAQLDLLRAAITDINPAAFSVT